MLKTELIAEAEFDLYKAGFGWLTANSGVHLQVTDGSMVVADYWPTTERLIFRKVGKSFDKKQLTDAIRRNIYHYKRSK